MQWQEMIVPWMFHNDVGHPGVLEQRGLLLNKYISLSWKFKLENSSNG
jgi:hypothetical protein